MWNPGEADVDGAAANRQVETAVQRERTLVLRNLVPLGQIGIEIVLAGEDGERLHLAAERQRGLDCAVHGHVIQHRSAPGSPRHTGQTCEFGGPPNAVLQPQKIFVCVCSCA
jgi:hypothetical protein